MSIELSNAVHQRDCRADRNKPTFPSDCTRQSQGAGKHGSEAKAGGAGQRKKLRAASSDANGAQCQRSEAKRKDEQRAERPGI